ncbi:translocation/assembly module TamB domain-containing protein [Alteromonas lipolytica]|uniref:Translocation and assembly module TamB C-terminal domain-containing protein n=1 Tax=Alteromonas lipolytica TaxID=1856405 RepID=A0A1E8FAN8_9ALTE|nr:translocation/assembly module TamB domain-containing protein [Alteromonas lipolytica]OFI32969.1 hypothetical protein BFC17_01445 [Alteromonas lipolytica]GGF63824.1 DUF490 domain-containing protein [Alteromonas lipolytica]
MSINRLARFFLLILLTVLLLAGALLSPLGTPLLSYAANKYVPGLSVKSISGSVLSELTVEQLNWQNEQWQVSVARASIAHDWHCLLNTQACITALKVTSPHVTQLAVSAPAESATTEPTGDISLPLGITIDALTVSDVRFNSPAVNISAQQLTGQLSWIDVLRAQSLHLDGVELTLPESEPQPKTPLILAYQAPALPEVYVPLSIDLINFNLTDFSVVQGKQELVALDASLNQAQIHGNEVRVTDLQVNMPQLQAGLNGKLSLSGQYPLELALLADLPVEDSAQHAELNASGDLSDLALTLTTSGLASADIKGNINVLNDNLPVSLHTQWPAQTLKPLADVQLDSGVMSVQGQMGEYAIQLNGAATIPDVSPVKVDLLALLGDRSLAVSALNSEILQGEVTNSGILYFSESLSWEGITRLTGVDLQTLSENAPGNLNGVLKAQVNINDKGPNILVSDIRLTGEHLRHPFSLSGDAVYSANSDIMVANLAGDLASNQFSAVGQVFNKQYLDALIALDLPELAALYPDISGYLNGTVAVKGEWATPVIDGKINLTNVAASPRLSEAAANEGPLNGEINLQGSLAEHNLTANLRLPEHTTTLNLQGQWQDQQWRGVLSDTQLAILNTVWKLQTDVELSFDAESQHAIVSKHCWKAREQGSLCINNMDYTPAKIAWNVQADSLPLGLWVDELMPELLVERNNAMLNIATSGNFNTTSQNAAGQLQINVSPDRWQLAGNEPVTINLDEVSFSGEFDEQQLALTGSIKSPQIGAITSQATIFPFTETPGIEASINIADWQLAPFKPLIARMEELTGDINGNITLKGPLSLPAIEGQLSLQDGFINSEDLPVTIGQWHQTINLNGASADFEGDFLLGDGPGKLSGSVDWQDELLVDLAVKGDAFTVHYDGSQVKVSPDLEVALRPHQVDITGRIDIPWARVKIEELPPSAVSPSRDVHLRGEPPSEALVDNINANIMVTIDDDEREEVRLDAFGLKATLTGGLNVQTQPALTGYGDLRILSGRYAAYGQNLIIRTGEVQFNGPLDQPILLVEAIRDPDVTEDDVIAGVRVEGPANQPSVSLFSEPTMDQAKNLAYLLNGSGGLGGGQMDESAYAAMLIGFGISSSESLTSNVGNALGIEDLSLSTTGQGDNTKVAISGKIAPNLTVRYGVGMFSEGESGGQEVALRYQILSDLYLEIVRSLYVTVDLYYQFTLGDNKPPAKEETSNKDN